jgi:hypothetical protein
VPSSLSLEPGMRSSIAKLGGFWSSDISTSKPLMP